MFKTIMKSNSKVVLDPFHIINPLTKMWRIIFNSTILFCNINCYDSSVGLVEDEHVFRNLNFIKTKTQN
jgi:hypothetical protein